MKRFKYLALATLVAFAACDEGEDITQVDPVVGTVTVNVTAEGEGVEGVQVTLAGPSSQSATTPASGTVTFQNVSEGSYAVTLSSIPGDVAFGTTAQTVTITEANQNPTLSFSGSFVRTASIIVNVSAGGDPLPGVSVTIDGPEGEETGVTGATGRQQFTGLRAGEYVVSIENPDEDRFTFTTTEQTIQLQAGGQREVNFVGTGGGDVSVAIESITSVATGLPVDRNNIAGLINIQVGIEEGGADVAAVEVYVNDQRVCRQTFASSVEEDLLAQEDIDCVVNTAAFNTITGDNPFTSEVEEDVPFAPVFLNGMLEIEARAILASGETVSATEEVTFNNTDVLALSVSNDNGDDPDFLLDNTSGLRWLSGDFTMTGHPIIYSAPFDPNNPNLSRATLSFQGYVMGDTTTFTATDLAPGDDGEFVFNFDHDVMATAGANNTATMPTAVPFGGLNTGSGGAWNFSINSVTQFGQPGPGTGNLLVVFNNELQSGTGVINNILRVDNEAPEGGAWALPPHPVEEFSRRPAAAPAPGLWVNHDLVFGSSLIEVDSDDAPFGIEGIGVDDESLEFWALLTDGTDFVTAPDADVDGAVQVMTGADLPHDPTAASADIPQPVTDEINDISAAAYQADLFGNRAQLGCVASADPNGGPECDDVDTGIVEMGVDGRAPVLEITNDPVENDSTQYNPFDNGATFEYTANDTNQGFSGVAGSVNYSWMETDPTTMAPGGEMDGDVADSFGADETTEVVPQTLANVAQVVLRDLGTPGTTRAGGPWVPAQSLGATEAYWDVGAETWDRAGNSSSNPDQAVEDNGMIMPNGPDADPSADDEFIVDATAPNTSNVRQSIVPQYVGGDIYAFEATFTDNVDLQDFQFGYDFDDVAFGTIIAAGDFTLPVMGRDIAPFGSPDIITQYAAEGDLDIDAQFVACVAVFDATGAMVAQDSEPENVRARVWDHSSELGLTSTEANNIVPSSVPTDCAFTGTEFDFNAITFHGDSVSLSGESGVYVPAFNVQDVHVYSIVDPDGTGGTGDEYLKLLDEDVTISGPTVTDTGSGATGRTYTFHFSDTVDTIAIDFGGGMWAIFTP